MITEKMTNEQIRRAGMDVLKRELGVAGMARFLQMLETGQGDYTEDRHEWQDQMTVEELYARIVAKRQEKAE